jgi:hypothetical protein
VRLLLRSGFAAQVSRRPLDLRSFTAPAPVVDPGSLFLNTNPTVGASETPATAGVSAANRACRSGR